MLALAILIVSVLFAGWPGVDAAPDPAQQQSLAQSLGHDAFETPARLVRTSTTVSGYLMIEFVLVARDNAQASRMAALADVLALVGRVYQDPATTPRPLNVTLLGVWRPSSTASTVPVLYASLPADRLVGLDWTHVQPGDLATLGVVRWLPSGVCRAWHDCGPSVG
jgi:hypothetical protein